MYIGNFIEPLFNSVDCHDAIPAIHTASGPPLWVFVTGRMRYRFVVLDFGANAVSNPEKNGIHGFRILRAVPLTTSGGNKRPVSILRLPQFVERVESSSTQAQVAGTRSLFADQRGCLLIVRGGACRRTRTGVL